MRDINVIIQELEAMKAEAIAAGDAEEVARVEKHLKRMNKSLEILNSL